MTLHEELGCITQMFCDKTGTLTKNELKFRAMSIDG
jgi:P-type E1-E2 ATPase